jgi:RNA polymerase sigma-70 factor, ECF subfamily
VNDPADASPSTSIDTWEDGVIELVRAGDRRALGLAFDQYGGVVFGVAQRLVGPDQAGRIARAVFVDLWLRPSRDHLGQPWLRGRLVASTRRRAIHHARTAVGRPSGAEAIREASRVAPNVDEATIAMFAAERARGALDNLPDDQRRTLELAYYHGLTLEGIASVTDLPSGRVLSLLRDGAVAVAGVVTGEWTTTDHDASLAAWALDALPMHELEELDRSLANAPAERRLRAARLRDVVVALSDDLTAEPPHPVRVELFDSLQPPR